MAYIPVARNVRISAVADVSLPFRCDACKRRGTAHVVAIGYGNALGPLMGDARRAENQAAEEASFDARERAQRMVDQLACPHCGVLGENGRLLGTNAVLATIGAFSFGAFVAGYGYISGARPGAALVLCGIGPILAVLLWYRRFREREQAHRSVVFDLDPVGTNE